MKKNAPTLEELVAVLPDETVRSFLLEAARNDPMLTQRIVLSGTPSTESVNLNAWKGKISERVRLIRKKMNFEYDWQYDGEYDEDVWDEDIDSLDDLLSKYVDMLLENGRSWEAFSLIKYTYEQIQHFPQSDEFCTGSQLADMITEKWHTVVMTASPKLQERMYESLMAMADPESVEKTECPALLEQLREPVLETLLTAFSDVGLMERTERLLKELLEEAEGTECAFWVNHLLSIMEQLNRSNEELDEIFDRFDYLESVLSVRIDRLIRTGQYEEAEKRLRECAEKARRAEENCENWQRQNAVDKTRRYIDRLLELFVLMGRSDDHRQLLKSYLLTYPQHNLNRFHEYKAAVPTPQWPDELSSLLDSATLSYVLPDLLIEEGLFRRLLDLLETTQYPESLFKYNSVLKQHYPEELRDVMLNYLRDAMPGANGRERYACLVGLLDDLRTYPDSEQAAQALADEWRIAFKRRSALREELKKKKF